MKINEKNKNSPENNPSYWKKKNDWNGDDQRKKIKLISHYYY